MSEPPSEAALGRTAFELQLLLEADVRACPICRYVADRLSRRVDAMFYEQVTDPAIRDIIRQARGFCLPHSRLIARQADALGSALILQDVLQQELRDIDSGKRARLQSGSGALSRLFDGGKEARSPGACPLCKAEEEMAERGIDGLLDALRLDQYRAVYSGSTGLCLPHFRLAFTRCRDETVWQVVLATERAGLGALVAELGRLAESYDHRHTDRPSGPEADSWLRALSKTAGQIDV